MTIKELQELRRKLAVDMTAIVQEAEQSGAPMTPEQTAKFDALEVDYDKTVEQIEDHNATARRIEKATAAVEQSVEYRPAAKSQKRLINSQEAVSQSFRDALSQYTHLVGPAEMSSRLAYAMEESRTDRGAAHTQLFHKWLASEGRVMDGSLMEAAALQMDSDVSGGVLVPPIEFIARLIDGLDDQVFMRQFATVLPMTTAAEVRLPSLDNDPADAQWTVELSAGNEDSTMNFGARSLMPHPVGKFIKVSKDLLRQSAINVSNLVADRLRYKFGITEEKAYMTGSGAGQPLGIFTASTDGISTSRDVSTDNTTTAITAEGLIECKYSLRSQYHTSPGFRWIFHRTAVKQIRKLKDGNGQFLWQPGLSSDKGDTILDVPFSMSEYAPSTFTTGLYVGIIGDFSQYYIVDVTGMEMEEARELHIAQWQTGFYARRKLDGMPVLEEAFARVTLA